MEVRNANNFPENMKTRRRGCEGGASRGDRVTLPKGRKRHSQRNGVRPSRGGDKVRSSKRGRGKADRSLVEISLGGGITIQKESRGNW